MPERALELACQSFCRGSRQTTKRVLDAHGVPWGEVDLGDETLNDYGIYFFDPFVDGLEHLRDPRNLG